MRSNSPANGLYTTTPNPRVGCVIVKGDKVVGEGWHEKAGGPHAEIVALEQAGARAAGATLYVNLEPCNHHGPHAALRRRHPQGKGEAGRRGDARSESRGGRAAESVSPPPASLSSTA